MARRKKYSGWQDPPPASFVAGDEGYYVRHQVRKALKASAAFGRRVVSIDPSRDADAFSEVLSSSVLFSEPLLVLVENPEKLSLEQVQAHVEGDDNTVALVLVHREAVKAESAMGKLREVVPKPYRMEYPKPAPYKQAEVSAEFAVKEAERRGKKLSSALAEALVDKVGSDLGVLAFEVLKLAAYMDAAGLGEEVTPKVIQATMVQMGEVNLGRVVDMLGKGSVKGVLKALETAKKNASEDITLQTVAWVGNRATTWLHAAVLSDQGASESEGASRVGVNPYVYRQFILPTAKMWGARRLMPLLRRLPAVEIAVRSGHVSPWTQLECILVKSCLSVSSPR